MSLQCNYLRIRRPRVPLGKMLPVTLQSHPLHTSLLALQQRTPLPLGIMAQRQQLDSSSDSGEAGVTSKCNYLNQTHLLLPPAVTADASYQDR